MYKKTEDEMSAQEFHDKKFKNLAVQHYERLIRAAEKADDTERLEHLTKRFELLEAGDLSIAKHLTFVYAGSSIYYDEQQKRVVTI